MRRIWVAKATQDADESPLISFDDLVQPFSHNNYTDALEYTGEVTLQNEFHTKLCQLYKSTGQEPGLMESAIALTYDT